MGEVYLAEDSRLRRRVALKILPAMLVRDERAQKRLLREAQSAATLDHPNICTVYEAGEADGHSYIAMQYVEGETLAARLKRGPLDLATAASVGSQIARALAEAHRHGIVHRDVKPQNVMISKSGQVKVLDFGLAKSTTFADDAETATHLTETGMVAGTVAYMSPEQARGEALDDRTDVFSLGTVLYECIARTHPFSGGTAADTTSHILMRDPPALDREIPSEIRRIVSKCLEKDRERRYQTARDLAIDLDAVSREPVSRGSPALAARRTPSLVWAAAAILLLGVVGATWWAIGRRSGSPIPAASDFEQLTAFSDAVSGPALSPKGDMIAFIRDSSFWMSTDGIYVKVLPNGDAVRIANDPRPTYGLTFTPDGSRVVYTAIESSGGPGFHSWSVPVLGGQEPTQFLPNASGLTWIGDKQLLFSEIDGQGLHMGLVTATETRQDRRAIYYFAAESGGTSHLWRQRFPNSAPEPLTFGPTTDEQGIAVAQDGRSIVTSIGRRTSTVWWHAASEERSLTPEGSAIAPSLSADGKRVYCLLERNTTAESLDLAAVEIATSRIERLIPGFSIIQYDVSNDDKSVVFTTSDKGEHAIWIASLDRQTAPIKLLDNADLVFFAAGRQLVFRALEGHSNYLDRINRDGSERARVLKEPIVQLDQVSADGAWAQARLSGAVAGTVVVSIETGVTHALCAVLCSLAWSPDVKYLSVGSSLSGALPTAPGTTATNGRSILVPLAPGQVFPPFPADGSMAISAWAGLPNVTSRAGVGLVPGTDPATYVFTRTSDHRNLFRIPIR